MEDFVLGVASSVFATFVIYLSRNIWQNWWHLLFSKNYPNVRGRYKISDVTKKDVTPWYPEEKQFCEVRQFGSRLSGRYEVFSGDERKHSFPMFGKVGTDRAMLLCYESDDPEYTSKGALLVRMRGIDEDLTGEHIFICLRCEEVHRFKVTMGRLNGQYT